MHPCREYWGQDIAYGSLVTGGRLRRAERVCALPEVYILDIDAQGHAPRHAELVALMRRINGFDGREESLRQSAAHLKEFLQSGSGPAGARGGPVHRRDIDNARKDVRILGIATLHRAQPLPPGSFAEAAGIPSTALRAESSAQLCAEFMQRLGELGAGKDVSQIDWVVVRVGDQGHEARSHLGATRVSHVNLQPFEPGSAAASRVADPCTAGAAAPIGEASSAARPAVA